MKIDLLSSGKFECRHTSYEYVSAAKILLLVLVIGNDLAAKKVGKQLMRLKTMAFIENITCHIGKMVPV